MGKISIPSAVLKYNGVIDYDNLFKKAYDWLSARHFDVNETKYKHSVPNPKGNRQEIGWKSDRKITAYIEYHIDVDFLLWDIQDVEVVKDNKKQRMSHVKMRITIKPWLLADQAGIFQGSKFSVSLGNFFQKYIYNKDLGMVYYDQLYYQAYQFHAYLKGFLDMDTKSNAY